MRWELFKEQTESASCYGAFFLSLSALSGFLATYQANDTALIATSIYRMSSGLFLMRFGYEHDETKPTIALRLQGAMYRFSLSPPLNHNRYWLYRNAQNLLLVTHLPLFHPYTIPSLNY